MTKTIESEAGGILQQDSMPHSDTNKLFCKSTTQLSAIVDSFVTQDGDDHDMETLLQECVDTLVNYQEEVKKIKRIGAGHTVRAKDVVTCYESAFVYYKIVSQIVLNKIPGLEQFSKAKVAPRNDKEKGLMEIYNMLVKTLLTDEKIAEIRKFIKDHSACSSPASTEKHENGVDLNLKNGQSITSEKALSLMKQSKVLCIDVRPRIEFIESHIKCASIMCIEPISFKNTYSDAEVSRKSLITSPNSEIETFQKRDEFSFILIYTNESEKTGFCTQQQAALLDLLINRSFEKPLKKTVVLTLRGGFHSWCLNGGPCETSRNQDDSIYINGDISSLSLQELPKLNRRNLDNSFQPMLTNPKADVESGRTSLFFPDQQHGGLKRSSSFKNAFSTLTSPSRSSSPSFQTPDSGGMKFTTYPETPKLVTSNLGVKPLPQISPIQSRALTPLSRSFTPPRVFSNNQINSLSMDGSGKARVFSPPPRQPLPVLPQKQATDVHTLQHPSNSKDLDFCVGLVNLGNSCYMNCIIQCLLGTHELSQIFLNDSYKNHVNLNSKLGSRGVLAKYFSNLVHMMYQQGKSLAPIKKRTNSDEKTAVQPLHFKVACGSINSLFKGSSQQDCQEFCQFVLDGLHEDLNQCGGNPPLKELSSEAEKVREKLTMRIASSIEWERYLTTDFSVIVDLFQGQYASQLKCKVCGRTSTTYQPFSVLSVPVPRGTRCDILDCFKEFTKIETLEKDEQWSCPDCKKKQPSTKKITITRLPRNLIIHLKRFDNMLNKNNIFVNYPYTLDLTSFWANDFDGRLPQGVTELPTRGQVPPFRYNLYAVAAHSGTLYGGHYTSYVNKGSPQGWCYFDDTNWRKVKNDKECITQNAYVLFYHRVYGI